MKDYDIDSLIKGIDFKSGKFQNINGIMLTNREIDILKRYNIPYKKCNTLKEILFEIEDTIQNIDGDITELEEISDSISERDYYQNTNK